MKRFLLLFILSSTLFFNTPAFTQNQFAVSDSNVSLIGSWAKGPCYTSFVAGNKAYIGNGGELNILNIDHPQEPILLGSINLPSTIKGIVVTEIQQVLYAFVADWKAGLRIINVNDASNPI